MMPTLDQIWAYLLAGITGLVWLVRLEAKTVANTEELRRLRDQRAEDQQAAKDSRAEDTAIAKASRDEMLAMLKEVRADVKDLIRVAK
jgi:hypothetical protein